MKKTTVIALATLLTTAVPIAASAQSHLEKAFRLFIKENKVNTNMMKGYNSRNGKYDKYLASYTFTLKGKDKQRIQPLLDAFDKDESDAYSIIRQTDGDHNGLASLTLVGHPTVIVGEKYDNSTLMCFFAPTDSTFRYAYALEWDNDRNPADGYVRGRLIMSYSERPASRWEKKGKTFARYSDPSIYFDKKHRGIVFQNFDRLGTLTDVERAEKQLEKYQNMDSDKIDSLVQQSNTLYYIDGKYLPAGKMAAPTWLSQFNAMCRLIEKHPNTTATSYYVSTVYDLCKHSSRLDSNECRLAIDEINRLSKRVNSTFSKKLLAKAAEMLKETEKSKK